MSAILKVRGCRLIEVIEGSSPFLGICFVRSPGELAEIRAACSKR